MFSFAEDSLVHFWPFIKLISSTHQIHENVKTFFLRHIRVQAPLFVLSFERISAYDAFIHLQCSNIRADSKQASSLNLFFVHTKDGVGNSYPPIQILLANTRFDSELFQSAKSIKEQNIIPNCREK
jgi:hypothetical protein